MKLNFSIDTDEMYDEDGDPIRTFENLLTDGLKRSIIDESKGKLTSQKFNEFSKLVSETLVAEIKLKLENFLSEEIVLTDTWGKKTFVGSIEDLIKMRFDDILLRPVDSRGETLQGCTTSGQTWIEWSIEKQLKGTFDRELKRASETIEISIKKSISQQLSEMADKAIKSKVNATFASILEQQKSG